MGNYQENLPDNHGVLQIWTDGKQLNSNSSYCTPDQLLLPESFYNHFLTLTVAMSILLDSEDNKKCIYSLC